MIHKGRYAQSKRKRVLAGLVGFLMGVAVGVPLNYVFYGHYIDFTTFVSGLAGFAIALFLGERKKNLPTAGEVRGLRFKEKLNPLDLSSSNSTDRKQGRGDLPPS